MLQGHVHMAHRAEDYLDGAKAQDMTGVVHPSSIRQGDGWNRGSEVKRDAMAGLESDVQMPDSRTMQAHPDRRIDAQLQAFLCGFVVQQHPRPHLVGSDMVAMRAAGCACASCCGTLGIIIPQGIKHEHARIATTLTCRPRIWTRCPLRKPVHLDSLKRTCSRCAAIRLATNISAVVLCHKGWMTKGGLDSVRPKWRRVNAGAGVKGLRGVPKGKKRAGNFRFRHVSTTCTISPHVSTPSS